MFERFTERARQVVVLAQEEARSPALKHNYIGTEHILLGLLREEEGLAARVLESLGITVERAREQVVRIVGSGEVVAPGQIPFTPHAKRVLELALREGLTLGHNYIGTEHILLGLISENEGVAFRIRPEPGSEREENEGVAIRILLAFDADAETIRNEVIRMLSGPEAQKYVEAKPLLSGRGNRYSLDQGWFDGLGGVLNGLAREIRRELEREPDTGDLLLALACEPDTLAAQALHELGVNPEALPGVIERVRAQQPPSAEAQLAQRIEEVRRAKELAIESQQFQTAAAMRDQERELTQQTLADDVVPPEVLQQIRRHLGIPCQTDNPPQPPKQS